MIDVWHRQSPDKAQQKLVAHPSSDKTSRDLQRQSNCASRNNHPLAQETNSNQDSTNQNKGGVNKQKVAYGFNKAAHRYNAQANVQHQITGEALNHLEAMGVTHANCALDIGCGTAISAHRLSKIAGHVVGVDISFNMLKQAMCDSIAPCPSFVEAPFAEKALLYQPLKDHHLVAKAKQLPFTAINADAESLPFKSRSIDLVYSSMALQWVESPFAAINEISRILSPKGKALLCILNGDSFGELQSAWQHLQLPSRINTFYDNQVWLDAAQNTGAKVQYTTKCFTTYHVSIIDMLQSIKRIGADTSIAATQKASTYIGKAEMLGLTHYLQDCKSTKKDHKRHYQFALSYSVLFLQLEY